MKLIINDNTTPERIKKALEQMEQQASRKKLKDSFGKLPDSYGHALSYQHKLREKDWA